MSTATLSGTATTFASLKTALAHMEAILRDEYRRQLRVQCDKVLTELREDGWDADKRYGYPRSTCGRSAYAEQKRRYEMANLYTVATAHSRSMRDPDLRTPRADNDVRIDAQAAKLAADAIEGFCHKLAGKIDAAANGQPIESIAYQGGLDPWGWSYVIVNGTQRWQTRMIVNVSCLGKLFNQWPTRLVA